MTKNIDEIRTGTLRQIEKTESYYKFAFIVAALIEVIFFAAFILLADFKDRVHLLLFIAAVAIYTILASGLITLGLHMNRNTLRVIRAIETMDR